MRATATPVRHQRQGAARRRRVPATPRANNPTGSIDFPARAPRARDSTAASVSAVVLFDQSGERRLRRRQRTTPCAPASKARQRRPLRGTIQIGVSHSRFRGTRKEVVSPSRWRGMPRADKAARHGAKPLGIEVAEIDDIHGSKIARIGLSFRGRNGVNQSLLRHYRRRRMILG